MISAAIKSVISMTNFIISIKFSLLLAYFLLKYRLSFEAKGLLTILNKL